MTMIFGKPLMLLYGQLTLGLFKAYELYQGKFGAIADGSAKSNSNSNSNTDERSPKRPRH